ncbi:hypothetical protein JCM1393_20430 [Clostridium carnis]
MIEILKLSTLLTIGIIGSLVVFGLLIGQIEKKSSQLIYNGLGKYGVIFTGIIGTTVHEFSHAIMCKLFLHKIIDIKWFSLSLENRELGYVKHTFNKRNIYQRIGNFFIGIAPIIVGSTILIIFYRLFLKDSFYSILNTINVDGLLYLGKNFNLLDFIHLLFNEFSIFAKVTFTIENITSLGFWIFLIIAISVSTHMSLSKADLRNSLDGVIFIFVVNLIISFVLVLFRIPEMLIMSRLIIFNVFLISFLSIGIFFSLITLLISKLISLI